MYKWQPTLKQPLQVSHVSSRSTENTMPLPRSAAPAFLLQRSSPTCAQAQPEDFTAALLMGVKIWMSEKWPITSGQSNL